MLFLPKLYQPAIGIFNPNKRSKITSLLLLGKRYSDMFKMLERLVQIMYLEI